MKSASAYLFFIVFLLSNLQCKKIFEFSPYEIKLEEKYLNTTSKNLTRLQQINAQFSDTAFTVALLSDFHYYYNDLEAAVNLINSRNEIDFVIVTGDLVDRGLQQEYKLMHDKMSKLNVPWLTVIGNHDYLSDGEKIYDMMFGARNYSFSFSNTKFIFFDDVFWESEKTPDFGWLQSQFSDNGQYKHTIVCNHIPPDTDQFDNESKNVYLSTLADNSVELSICGHQHYYQQGSFSGDKVPYVLVPSIDDHILVELTVSPSSTTIATLNF
jgi:3',5'-cyclic-AMP phosphodiesterase